VTALPALELEGESVTYQFSNTAPTVQYVTGGVVEAGTPGAGGLDGELYYDNGIASSGNGITNTSYYGVKFSPGSAGMVFMTRSYCFGLATAGEMYFELWSDSSGQPGSLLWTSADSVYVPVYTNMWADMPCAVDVPAVFYVAARTSAGTAGNIAQWRDNNGNQAPAGTQWRHVGTSWSSYSATGDLMIRCIWTPGPGTRAPTWKSTPARP
jgi:hypothetical protein